MKKLMIVCLVLVISAFSTNVFAENELNGKYMTLLTPDGKVIVRTAHEVVVGDRYLDSSDQLYEVRKVSGNKAFCQRTLDKSDSLWSSVIATFSSIWNGSFFKAQARGGGPIAIYHTHSDESYTPTDGTSSRRGNGGVFKVGDQLAKEFKKSGIPSVHSTTAHDPHDAMAYDRSRRTAADLIKKNQPSVLLDVHRDAVPRGEYATKINGQGATKIQLVVGRQNPNFQATNKFAKQIKKIVDRKQPGLIKGVFYGKGKYNQDLTPRLMLLEFGTNTNSRESAERSAKIFADAAAEALRGEAGMGIANRGGWQSLFWIVAAVIGCIGLFILMNHGSLKDIGKEFTGAFDEEVPKELTAHPDPDDDDGNSHGELS